MGGSLSHIESANRTLNRIKEMEEAGMLNKKFTRRPEIMKRAHEGNGSAKLGTVEAARTFDKSPQALLVMANQEPAKSDQRPASEYVKVVHVLREKGFSWDAIEKWFKARGVNLSMPTFYYAYKKAQASKPGALVTH